MTKLHLAAHESAIASDRARRLHAAELIDFLNVLATKQATLDAQNREADARIANVLDAVDLYVAIGAGWQGNACATRNSPSVSRSRTPYRALSRVEKGLIRVRNMPTLDCNSSVLDGGEANPLE